MTINYYIASNDQKKSSYHLFNCWTHIIDSISGDAVYSRSRLGYNGFCDGAVILLVFGFVIDYAWRRLRRSKYRVLIIAGILIALLLVWAELSVGIFGSPLAGS